jgi:hypothetical protein
MTNHSLGEGENVYKKVEDLDVLIGDTITYDIGNQQGYKKWKVIKSVELIDSYDHQLINEEEEEEEEEEGNAKKRQRYGGSKKKRNTKNKKNKKSLKKRKN